MFDGLFRPTFDQQPYRLWELPEDVRRSLRPAPKSATNDMNNRPTALDLRLRVRPIQRLDYQERGECFTLSFQEKDGVI